MILPGRLVAIAYLATHYELPLPFPVRCRYAVFAESRRDTGDTDAGTRDFPDIDV
jgi:hypothetical protein